MKTLAEALAWANGGWKTDKYAKTLNGVRGIDVDGQDGFQCKDFANAYAEYVGAPFSLGNAIVLWNQPQKNWTKQSSPKPGDVFVKHYVSGGVDYGHTGVVVQVLSGSFTSVDQNWYNASLTHGSPPAKVAHSNNDVIGFLRTNLGGGTVRNMNEGDRYNLLWWTVGQERAEEAKKMNYFGAWIGKEYGSAVKGILTSKQYQDWLVKSKQMPVATVLAPGFYKVQ